MSTTATPPTTESLRGDAAPTDVQHRAVFWDWCLRREALRVGSALSLVLPLALAELYFWVFWPRHWHPNLGRYFLQVLVGIAAMTILGGGAVHVARAFCWEVSPELRELVRLTGLGPVTLLCCKSLSRWWTIGCSVFLLTPLVGFAVTLGGVTTAQVWASGWVLLMLAALMAAMALVAGVSATEAENAATTATSSAFLLMLLYHLVFWFGSAMLYLMANSAPQLRMSPWWQLAHEFAWQSAPITIVVRAGIDPLGFSPLAPSYWIHFLTPLLAFWMASVVMIRRFRSIRGPTDAAEESTKPKSASFRPRLNAQSPLFWKDAYVLSGFRSRRLSDLKYGVLTIGVLVIGVAAWEQDLTALGVIALITRPIMFAVRLDALLAAEFRHQTWQSLMLLPIDRKSILWAKLRAVAWEQRAAVFPVGIAVAFAWSSNPLAMVMTAVIATLAGLQMCQISAYSYLTPRVWWTGPMQIVLITMLVGFCAMCFAAVGPWPGFFITVAVMVVSIMTVQNVIHEKLVTWTEL